MKLFHRSRKEKPLTIEEVKRIARAPILVNHYGGRSWGGAMPLPDDTTTRFEYDAWRHLHNQHRLPKRSDEEGD